jgi:hypothetical protein
MIDPTREMLLTFSQLAHRIPPSRQGRPVSVSTIWRWATRGIRGVRLESLRLPSRSVTSAEAFARFIDALTRNSTELQGDECAGKLPVATGSDAAKALDALGFGAT